MSKEEYLKRYLSNDQTDPSEKKKKKKKKKDKDKDKPIAKVLPVIVINDDDIYWYRPVVKASRHLEQLGLASSSR